MTNCSKRAPFPKNPSFPAAKEVAGYADALCHGFSEQQRLGGLLTNTMFQMLKRTDSGFRATPGTALKNDQTGSMVYIPPQGVNAIVAHMNALKIFINDDDIGKDGRVTRTLQLNR